MSSEFYERTMLNCLSYLLANLPEGAMSTTGTIATVQHLQERKKVSVLSLGGGPQSITKPELEDLDLALIEANAQLEKFENALEHHKPHEANGRMISDLLRARQDCIWLAKCSGLLKAK